MIKLTDDEWEKLNEFDSAMLLTAIDQFDLARPCISDGLNCEPPQFRNDLLILHQMAMGVSHHGRTSELREQFEKAEELSDQLY